MAVNKVVYFGQTLVDLSGDTVTADRLYKGYTAHNKQGAKITGTLEPLTIEDNQIVDDQSIQDSSGNNIKDSSNVDIDGQLIYRLV